MKKLLIVVATCVLLFSAAGCSSDVVSKSELDIQLESQEAYNSGYADFDNPKELVNKAKRDDNKMRKIALCKRAIQIWYGDDYEIKPLSSKELGELNSILVGLIDDIQSLTDDMYSELEAGGQTDKYHEIMSEMEELEEQYDKLNVLILYTEYYNA